VPIKSTTTTEGVGEGIKISGGRGGNPKESTEQVKK